MIWRVIFIWLLGATAVLADYPGHVSVFKGISAFVQGSNTVNNGANSFTIVAENPYGVETNFTLSLTLSNSVNLQYDANGNLIGDGTRTFQYDAENELTNVWLSGQWQVGFIYDGLNRRRIEQDSAWEGGTWVKTNETHFVFDGMLPVQERDSNNNVLGTYTRGLDLSGSVAGAGGTRGLLAKTVSISNYYYHTDANGNVTALIDADQDIVARAEYDAFGRFIKLSGLLANSNRYWFSSKEYVAQAGIYYYGYRFYEPNLQRWLNKDPIAEAGGINLYGFVDNNSVNEADPIGKWGIAFGNNGGSSYINLGWGNPSVYFSPSSLNDYAQSDPGRFFGRLGSDIVSLEEQSLQAAIDPAGTALNAYQGLANASTYLGALSADPCLQEQAEQQLGNYFSNPEAYADLTVAAELGLLGGISASEANAAEGATSVQLTQEGLNTVANHLAQFDEFAPNTQMMQNLQNAFSAGENVTGANANFYLHETTEAGFMQSGLSYDAAHAAALQQYGMSPFSLYTPEVIQANPTLFNNAWRTAAGLPPNP
jgi:RHS repeat-associated protein